MMKTVTYSIHLLEPALVTALAGDPNSAVAFDYIPGSVLRGALIGAFQRRNHFLELDVEDEDVRRRFLSDQTRYLNGYRLINGSRSIPVPRSWQTEKRTQNPLYDAVIARLDADKSWRAAGGFCLLERQSVTLAQVERVINVHIQRRRWKTDQREVYQYEALAANQRFGAAILCDLDDDAEWLCDYLDGLETWIGGARNAGYGRIRIENVRIVDYWHEGGSLPAAETAITLTLTSDAIVRNADGEYDPSLESVRRIVAQKLGIEPIALGKLEKCTVYLAPTMVGGFNRKWGLPLPQTAAVAMGSVFVFANPSVSAAAWQSLIDEGIGNRRAEGFGRVSVNFSTHNVYDCVEEKAAVPPPVPIIVTDALAPLAARLLAPNLDQMITETANSLRVQNPPKRSQINDLRREVRRQLHASQPDFMYLKNVLDTLGKRDVTRRQFERAQIDGQSLYAWLQGQCVPLDTDAWAKRLDQTTLAQSVLRAVVSSDDNRTRYQLRLIDAVLARAAKELQKERRNRRD